MENTIRLKMEFGVTFTGIGDPFVTAEFILRESAEAFSNLMNDAVEASLNLEGSKRLGGSYSVITL